MTEYSCTSTKHQSWVENDNITWTCICIFDNIAVCPLYLLKSYCHHAVPTCSSGLKHRCVFVPTWQDPDTIEPGQTHAVSTDIVVSFMDL